MPLVESNVETVAADIEVAASDARGALTLSAVRGQGAGGPRLARLAAGRRPPAAALSRPVHNRLRPAAPRHRSSCVARRARSPARASSSCCCRPPRRIGSHYAGTSPRCRRRARRQQLGVGDVVLEPPFPPARLRARSTWAGRRAGACGFRGPRVLRRLDGRAAVRRACVARLDRPALRPLWPLLRRSDRAALRRVPAAQPREPGRRRRPAGFLRRHLRHRPRRRGIQADAGARDVPHALALHRQPAGARLAVVSGGARSVLPARAAVALRPGRLAGGARRHQLLRRPLFQQRARRRALRAGAAALLGGHADPHHPLRPRLVLFRRRRRRPAQEQRRPPLARRPDVRDAPPRAGRREAVDRRLGIAAAHRARRARRHAVPRDARRRLDGAGVGRLRALLPPHHCEAASLRARLRAEGAHRAAAHRARAGRRLRPRAPACTTATRSCGRSGRTRCRATRSGNWSCRSAAAGATR